MNKRRFLGGAALLSGGALLYQAAAAVVFLTIRAAQNDADAATFFLAMAFSQMGGTVSSLNLQYYLIGQRDDKQAHDDASDILSVIILVTVSVVVLGWGSGMITTSQSLPVWLFMLALSLAELIRGILIRIERPRAAAGVQLMLAAALGAGGSVMILTERTVDVFYVSALCVLPIFFWHIGLPSLHPARIGGLLRRGSRFVLFRTPSTLTDFLTARGVVLIISSLGAEFVAVFFLTLRIVGLPVQLITWGVSLLFFRQASVQETDTSVAQLLRAWRFLANAGLPALWGLTTLTLLAVPYLEPIIGGGAFLPSVIAVVYCYSFMLAFVGWIGRLFDTIGAQAQVFVFELIGNSLLVGMFWFVSQSGLIELFLIFWISGHIVYNIFWCLFLFYLLGQRLRVVLQCFLMPQMIAVGGVAAIYFTLS